jgi:hypothetical protein
MRVRQCVELHVPVSRSILGDPMRFDETRLSRETKGLKLVKNLAKSVKLRHTA